MRGLRLNLLLLVVIILLTTITLYEPSGDIPVESPKLFSLSADEVNEISIHNGKQKTIVLRRDPITGWQMIAPLQIAANRYKVESVLDILKQEVGNQFITNRKKLASYGLHKPQVKLVLNANQTLLLGSQTPLDRARYLMFEDEMMCSDTLSPQKKECAKVATIKDVAFYPIASLYTNFITPRLLPEGVAINAIQLPGFQLKFKSGRWTFERLNGDNLTEMSPDIDRLAQWIDGWRYASSIDIEAIDPHKIVTPTERATITLQSGEELHWTISSSSNGLILGRPDLGIEYHMSDAQRIALLSPPLPETAQSPTELIQ